jgi:hypothetical protein
VLMPALGIFSLIPGIDLQLASSIALRLAGGPRTHESLLLILEAALFPGGL